MTTLRRITRSGIVLAAATLIAACEDTSGLESIEDPALRDMALVAADATLEVINTMGRPFGFGRISGGIPSLGGQGGFGRPGGHHGLGAEDSGTTVETFFDANGIQRDAYHELATARIDVETVIDGEVSRENWSATIYRERQMTVTRLVGEETHRTYHGTGSSKTSGSRHTDEGDRMYDMTGSFAYTDVVVPIPGSDPPYPTSGTISRSMSGTRTDSVGTEVRSMEMTITFDRDETASAVVNGEEYEIDLSTREGRRPWRGGRFGS